MEYFMLWVFKCIEFTAKYPFYVATGFSLLVGIIVAIIVNDLRNRRIKQ